MTGDRLREDTLPGTVTLRKRQSSLVLAVPKGDPICGQELPNLVASMVPETTAGTTGAAKRLLPVGAAAKRTPRNSVTPLLLTPISVDAGNVPRGVVTVGPEV